MEGIVRPNRHEGAAFLWGIGLLVTALVVAPAFYLGVYLMRVNASKAARPSHIVLGELRTQYESRMSGWVATETYRHRDPQPPHTVSTTVEYTKFPGLFFTIDYVNGRVACQNPIE